MMKTTAGWSELIRRDAAGEETAFIEEKEKKNMRRRGANCRSVTHTVALAKPVGATR